MKKNRIPCTDGPLFGTPCHHGNKPFPAELFTDDMITATPDKRKPKRGVAAENSPPANMEESYGWFAINCIAKQKLRKNWPKVYFRLDFWDEHSNHFWQNISAFGYAWWYVKMGWFYLYPYAMTCQPNCLIRPYWYSWRIQYPSNHITTKWWMWPCDGCS